MKIWSNCIANARKRDFVRVCNIVYTITYIDNY